MHVGFHIPAINNVDVNAPYLACDILGARDNSRLVRVLKKEKGLVNSIAGHSMTRSTRSDVGVGYPGR